MADQLIPVRLRFVKAAVEACASEGNIELHDRLKPYTDESLATGEKGCVNDLRQVSAPLKDLNEVVDFMQGQGYRGQAADLRNDIHRATHQ